MEQVFFNVPLSTLETMFKKWLSDVLTDKTNTSSPQPPKEEFLTIEQASRVLNLTIPTMYSKVSRGEIPAMKQGKRLYFSEAELIAFIKKGRKRTNVEIEADAQAYLSNHKKGGTL